MTADNGPLQSLFDEANRSTSCDASSCTTLFLTDLGGGQMTGLFDRLWPSRCRFTPTLPFCVEEGTAMYLKRSAGVEAGRADGYVSFCFE